jgi:hypothetical protein
MFEFKVMRARMGKACLVTLVLSAALFSASVTASKSKTELPEVSSDGLHLLKNTKVAVAYAKPGATLEPYTRIKLLDAFVDFRKDWQRDYNMEEIGLSGRISDKDAEAIKAGLAAEFKKIFTEELTKQGHEITDEVGPDVLLLRPALLNVDVTAPDTMSSGMGRTWIQSAGQMTLYMELYDSATSTLLARVVDPQADREGMAQPANRVTNKAAADRILRDWAQLLATRLGEVKQDTGSN